MSYADGAKSYDIIWACHLCARGMLGDEKHLIFEFQSCRISGSDGLICLRDRRQCNLLEAFMRQEDSIGIAKVDNACMNKMNPSLEGQAFDQLAG